MYYSYKINNFIVCVRCLTHFGIISSSPPVSESLEHVLEPQPRPRSSLCKDASPVPPSGDEDQPLQPFTRHRSQGEGEDPGVIGPLVWDLHCHRLHKQGHTLW